MTNLLSIQQLSYVYHTMQGETLAIENISFSVSKGQFISIVGPSGCGKSTLLSLISGLLAPSLGQIVIDQGVLDNPKHAIGYMLQKDHLFEWRTVYENVLLGLEIAHVKTQENLDYVNELLEKYELKDFKKYRPSQLSGGMRQRVALIRTLALKPDLLLLDEPFSALDYQTRLNVADDMYAIIKKEGKTALLVTHDIAEAISMADEVMVLSKRPASIKARLSVAFNIEDRSPLKSRADHEFSSYFNQIWRELNDIPSTI
ncbi:MAG: spermidine/putrescine ABC transporter ATP-binding protein [Firmicutes bacterium HGW-Firmicutes-1]|nr:MAG: spermidine/putrescine ABC transporter ATP-binding protein [Firmicutes bacterium HGW-Firmicutes-1]